MNNILETVKEDGSQRIELYTIHWAHLHKVIGLYRGEVEELSKKEVTTKLSCMSLPWSKGFCL